MIKLSQPVFKNHSSEAAHIKLWSFRPSTIFNWPLTYRFSLFILLNNFLQEKCFRNPKDAKKTFNELVTSRTTTFYHTGLRKYLFLIGKSVLTLMIPILINKICSVEIYYFFKLKRDMDILFLKIYHFFINSLFHLHNVLSKFFWYELFEKFQIHILCIFKKNKCIVKISNFFYIKFVTEVFLNAYFSINLEEHYAWEKEVLSPHLL